MKNAIKTFLSYRRLARTRYDEAGTTLINMLTVFAIVGIVSGTAVTSFKELSDPLANASFLVEHFVRLVRSDAISNTQTIKVSAQSNTRLIASSGATCATANTANPKLFIDLPTGASLADTTWEVCFSPRGLATSNVSFDITDNNGVRRTVSVALGGGTRVSGHTS